MKPDIPAARVAATHEAALDAVRSRPDISTTEDGRRALAAAWEVGPAAVIALCRNHPTPEEATAAERRAQFALVIKDAREQARRAAEAMTALEGSVPGGGDSLRREVSELLGVHRDDAEILAQWSELEERGERGEASELKTLVMLARVQDLRVALHKAHVLIQSVIAESHVPKRRRKS